MSRIDDLISRLSELRSQYSCFDENERDAYHTLSDAIEALQEQKTGKWIGDKCSVCGEKRAWYGCNPKYCPDCGSSMRGEEE